MALALRTLASIRLLLGTSAFLAPGLTTSAAFLPMPSGSLLAVRLFGCREALLGALLWTAKTPESRRRIVLAGAVVDGLDIVAAAWGFLGGDVEALPALVFGGGAMSGLVLAAVGWKGLGLGRVLAKTA